MNLNHILLITTSLLSLTCGEAFSMDSKESKEQDKRSSLSAKASSTSATTLTTSSLTSVDKSPSSAASNAKAFSSTATTLTSSPFTSIDSTSSSSRPTTSSLSLTDASDRISLPAPLSRIQMVNNVPIMDDAISRYEVVISGENNGCGVFCLGFNGHTEARETLLNNANDANVRWLAVPEIRADLAQSGRASSFITEDSRYQALQNGVNTAQVNLNQEVQQLSRQLNVQGTATRNQILSSSLNLTKYDDLYQKNLNAENALSTYLTSKEVFERFVNSSVKEGIMQTYIPGATTLLDALAYIRRENLVIKGRNSQRQLGVLHQSTWQGFEKTRTLLHTRYQDINGQYILGGTSGTPLVNDWNHFNLLVDKASFVSYRKATSISQRHLEKLGKHPLWLVLECLDVKSLGNVLTVSKFWKYNADIVKILKSTLRKQIGSLDLKLKEPGRIIKHFSPFLTERQRREIFSTNIFYHAYPRGEKAAKLFRELQNSKSRVVRCMVNEQATGILGRNAGMGFLLDRANAGDRDAEEKFIHNLVAGIFFQAPVAQFLVGQAEDQEAREQPNDNQLSRILQNPIVYLQDQARKGNKLAQDCINVAAQNPDEYQVLGFTTDTGKAYLEARREQDRDARQRLNWAAYQGQLSISPEEGRQHLEKQASAGDQHAQNRLTDAAQRLRLGFDENSKQAYFEARIKKGDLYAQACLRGGPDCEECRKIEITTEPNNQWYQEEVALKDILSSQKEKKDEKLKAYILKRMAEGYRYDSVFLDNKIKSYLSFLRMICAVADENIETFRSKNPRVNDSADSSTSSSSSSASSSSSSSNSANGSSSLSSSSPSLSSSTGTSSNTLSSSSGTQASQLQVPPSSSPSC